MDPAIVGALAGVLGALAGGSATVAAAWVAQKTQGRRELIQAEIHKRETLYGEFIGECSRLPIDALSHTLEGPQQRSGWGARTSCSTASGFRRPTRFWPRRKAGAFGDLGLRGDWPVRDTRNVARVALASPARKADDAKRSREQCQSVPSAKEVRGPPERK
jgi:hypothetical protein